MAYRKTKQLREFEPILSRNGYKFARCNGSHFIYIESNFLQDNFGE